MLLTIPPSTYVPKCADDFIGPARATAQLLDRAVARAKANGNAPLKFLFPGNPGVGKSALVRYLQSLLGCDKWSTTKLNGTKVNMEALDDIERSLHMSTLFGDYRMVWFEEADKIPNTAQCRVLTTIDELENGVCIACTSNCKTKEFEPRFQSRFQVIELQAPTAAEIETLLRRWTNAPEVSHIANMACGNVRQALLDLEGLLQVTEPMLAAA